jgi:hypothetical protein
LNIFFYGSYLAGDTPKQSYIADAISANTNLNATHFDSFHKYVVEWVPGSEGHLKWFLDGEYLFSISAEALKLTGATIPVEPMYLLFNTALSGTWGFPMPCPEGCDCNCVDPNNRDCDCALPPNMIANFPAYFLIDYVRVYQLSSDVANETDYVNRVGCSPPRFPTADYIKGKADVFKSKGDKEPLKPVAHGGASCSVDDDCGFGICKTRKCLCADNYTGPTCKVQTTVLFPVKLTYM